MHGTYDMFTYSMKYLFCGVYDYSLIFHKASVKGINDLRQFIVIILMVFLKKLPMINEYINSS
ncbi:hypothetical protein GENT5_03950 [Flavobacterium ammoniigenes]|uniref:Uncharacterized protein n=1 Tax=Flavobacterium ammoniigenes TaxID=1751095 RepID=A0ABN6KXS0_9FLAO|nr:hypothetical protein GENT5_03950 [Flavobacterium ammoniigenes]